MGQILRKNVFTGADEWVEFEAGVESIPSGWPEDRKTYSTAWTRPHESIGAAVHSSQVQEFNEEYKRHGIIGAYHREDGVLLSDDKQAFNRVLKLRNLRNNDAGYSDWAGANG